MRPRQAAMQLRRRLGGPARQPKRALSTGLEDIQMASMPAAPSSEGVVAQGGAVSLLRQAPYDALGDGWRETRDPLWTYTLHYHGWLAQLSADDAEATALSWIAEHRRGVGWEPYPTSMRLLHWLGWLQSAGGTRLAGPRERMLDSMAAQLEHLAAHVEEHIDGNHLWTNLAALTACGLGLRGPLAHDLLERFGPRFERIVQEQLYGDGVHRERTPTYHCLLAEQLAIVVDLARGKAPTLVESLEPTLRSMVAATGAFTHPDGDVALFGDSQRGAPVTPSNLAARTGQRLAQGNALAPEGGFARRRWDDWCVLWTFGGVGMPWQTGHAHADALALELSLGDERIIVDAGVGTYEVGRLRSYARATAAHNTATVGFGEPDQHEVWASHRVGRRARPALIQATDTELAGRVCGVFSPGTHTRTIERDAGDVVVRDDVAPFGPATVRWFVPHSATVVVAGGCADVVTVAGTKLRLETNAGALSRTRVDGWHAIGRRARRWCLATQIPRDGLVTRFVRG
ncbi:MAG: heparinase II/III family protein [Myxococcota bacterium]